MLLKCINRPGSLNFEKINDTSFERTECNLTEPGPYIARGQRGQLPPPGKLNFFSNIVFEFAELFLVAILLRNHTKID